jgi:predicted urease superfamily metal-dependent hydrolase
MSRTHGHTNRNIINHFTPCVVEQETHIHETKKPSVCRSPRVVKDGVAQSFDVLVLAFGRVLMLLMWLTLPSADV